MPFFSSLPRAGAIAALFASLLACQGAEAPDAAVCRDVLQRVCLARTCDGVPAQVPEGDGCEETLRARTGCGDDAFTFGTPSRDRMLDCRAILVRESGIDVGVAPACADAGETFAQCPELGTFLEAR